MGAKLEVFDVGNGFSALWSFADADDTHMLVDINLPEAPQAEQEEKGDRVNVIDELKKRITKTVVVDGKRRKYLDILVISHPDEDHLRGVAELAGEFEIGELWETGLRREDDPDVGEHYRDFVGLAKRLQKKGCLRRLRASEEPIRTIADAQIFCLFPIGKTDEEEEAIPNDASLVLKVECEGMTVLLPGDSGHDSWRDILQRFKKKRSLLRSHILNASHHGSRSFFREDVEEEPYLDGLEAIAPEKVFFSCRPPDYSSDQPPHKDAIAIYERQVGKQNLFFTHICKVIKLLEQEEGSWKVVCGQKERGDEGKRAAAVVLGSARRTSERTFG
jgi:beta-lactamase superfamily II metal-dependent hydrolase